MEQFFKDISEQLSSYYSTMVTLLPKLVLAAVVFIFLYLIASRLRSVVRNRLTQRMDDPLLAIFLARITKIGIVILALMVVLRIVGLSDVAAGLITGASVSAIVIGFAFKDIGENFLAGIMLAFNRPFRVGDVVELNGQKGKVVSLDMRTTQIKSFDGRDIFIPNANVVKTPVINHTIDGFVRQEFIIGLDYDSDIEQAISILEEIINGVEGILKEEKAPSIGVHELGNSSMDISVQYWLNTLDPKISGRTIKTEALSRSVVALQKAGFYLPGNIVELKNYQNEELKTGALQGQKQA